jgi:hypothetical protein
MPKLTHANEAKLQEIARNLITNLLDSMFPKVLKAVEAVYNEVEDDPDKEGNVKVPLELIIQKHNENEYSCAGKAEIKKTLKEKHETKPIVFDVNQPDMFE